MTFFATLIIKSFLLKVKYATNMVNERENVPQNPPKKDDKGFQKFQSKPTPKLYEYLEGEYISFSNINSQLWIKKDRISVSLLLLLMFLLKIFQSISIL
jgi:hypothetical protein